VDLIHPDSVDEVRATLRDASERGTRVAISGNGTHRAKGEPCEVDADLSTRRLDGVVAYDPAEMLAVVEAGIEIERLADVVREGGQEWPFGAGDGTVGGTIATATSSPRRLRTGPIRDSIVEMEVVTGDGRLVRSGARTVKNVTGYDVHRLMTGSLGTLGAIVRVALKLRPQPKARRLLVSRRAGLEAGRAVLDAVPLTAAVIATPDETEVALEGFPEEVEEQTAAVRRAIGDVEVRHGEPIGGPEVIDASSVVEVAVVPSRLPAVLDGIESWRALVGVGIAWVGLPDDGERLRALRRRAAEAGGIAPSIRGPGGLGDAPLPAIDVHRRLKAAFDPAGILAPGRFWGGL
jgi:glycolate oxidase FAD binding subunit